MTYPHATKMALTCKAHDAALDAGKPSPFTADEMAIALAWLNRSNDADIDAALAAVDTYAEHLAVPTLGEPKWVSDVAPPAIGSPIIVTMNGCGPAIVTGYFTQGGYLGLLCTLTAAPDWHVKQNKGNPRGHVFGPEFKPAETPHNVATPYGKACFARDWLEARMNGASDALKAIPGVGAGAMGLTPDDVKQADDYRRAKGFFDASFARLREFNKGFTKTFKKELAADRAAKRVKR